MNSHTSTSETTPQKQLFLNSIVIHRNFRSFFFLKGLNFFVKALSKKYSSPVTNELLFQDGSTFHTHRNHTIPYYPKEHLIYPHVQSYKHLSTINDPDLDSYQDKDLDSNFDSFPSNYDTSKKTFH